MKKLLSCLLMLVLVVSTLGVSTMSLAEEYPTLDIVMMASAGKDGADEVVDAVNEYLEEQLGIHVNITWISYGNYATQLGLLLAAGDGIDVFAHYLIPLSTSANNGTILPLNDLLEEYGQGIIEEIGEEYLTCTSIDGVIYGITTGRDTAAAYGFEMRKDICDKYGIDYENITTLDELHEALLIVHENEPDLVCVVPSNGELVRNWGWDTLGDASVPLGVLMDKGQDTTVVNLFETDYFYEFCTTMRQWYEEGLIMQDATANTESVGTMMGAGTAFGGFMNLKPYFEVQETTNYGTEIVTCQIIDEFSCTSNVDMASWCIASSTKYPELCMQLLNLMYTDPTLVNMLIYGLEDVHYVVVGEASNGQSVIDYPEGLDSTTTGYRPSGGWLWTNQFIGHVWNGNPEDYWDVTKEWNQTALKSKAFGFVWDSSEVTNQLTACTNVLDKYWQALMCGAVDPDETIPQFNEELHAAGIDDIIESKQTQLDAWLAEQDA